MGTRLLEIGVRFVINQSVDPVELEPSPEDWSCLTAICAEVIFSILIRYILSITSAGPGYNPGWETPFSPGFPTRIANPGLKAPPLVSVAGIESPLPGLNVPLGHQD
jgi:hypothetical protein